MSHVADSAEQRSAERLIIDAISRRCNVSLQHAPSPLELSPGVSVKVDALSFEPPVFVEVFARQQPLLAGQRGKLAQDMLKLVTLRTARFPHARLIVALASRQAEAGISGWLRYAAQTLDIEIMTVALPEEVASMLRRAERRQRTVNRVMVPIPDAPLEEIFDFAQTYNGYKHHGDDGAGELANRWLARYQCDASLPPDLPSLRCCLFFEQRRWRHVDEEPDPATDTYLRALVTAIAHVSGGDVPTGWTEVEKEPK
jgi:hypothetical protein